MKILYGVQKPDDGTISVNGDRGDLRHAGRRDRPGHRHGLPALHAGRQPDRRWRTSRSAPRSCTASATPPAPRSCAISERYGFGLDPDELVETLGVGERQRVEILKVLYRGAKIIILDEPTAVLVPQEVDALFENLRQLKAQGHTLIFISHKLDEVLAIADDITVHPARHHRRLGEAGGGHLAQARRADGRQRAALAQHRGVHGHRPGAARACATSSSHDAAGRTELADIDLDIHAGEVLGIAGVEGNGQTELVETLIGMRHPVKGTVRLGRRGHQPLVAPATAARPASATSPRTGSGTDCCWTHRCGRTASSATRPARRRSRVDWLNVGGARGTPSASSSSTTSARPASTPPPGRCPAATSRSSSSAAR